MTRALGAAWLVLAAAGAWGDEPGWLPVQLTVSAEVKGILAPLEKDAFDRAELEPLFQRLHETGDAFCKRWKTGKHSPLADAYVRVSLRDSVLKRRSGGRTGMSLGCRNFYEMNDIHPERDFALVRALEAEGGPEPTYDCYGVGVMQPWLMHRAFGCRRLGMVDLDWRILEAHHRLAALFSLGRLRTADDAGTALSTLDARWVALHALDADGRMKDGLPLLCRARQEGECRAALAEVQHRPPPRRVELLLSGLEDVELGPADVGARRVVFLSNALEYMKAAGARSMLEHLAGGLPDGAHAVLIHHAGGTAGFGLYRLERGLEGEPRVSVVCRDAYRDVKPHRKSDTYENLLDALTPAGVRSPTCAALLRRYGLDAPPEPVAARPPPTHASPRMPPGQAQCLGGTGAL